MSSTRWHLRLFGRVQHVGFRYTAYYAARRMHLTGWVRNLADGSVEMEVQGEVTDLRRLLIHLKSQPHLHIEKTLIDVIPIKREGDRFRVIE